MPACLPDLVLCLARLDQRQGNACLVSGWRLPVPQRRHQKRLAAHTVHKNKKDCVNTNKHFIVTVPGEEGMGAMWGRQRVRAGAHRTRAAVQPGWRWVSLTHSLGLHTYTEWDH